MYPGFNRFVRVNVIIFLIFRANFLLVIFLGWAQDYSGVDSDHPQNLKMDKWKKNSKSLYIHNMQLHKRKTKAIIHSLLLAINNNAKR